MPFDSNGTFNRVMNWVNDAAASIKIRADRHDQEDDNFAQGLSTCITKDGRTQPTAHLPMNGKKLLNVGEPTEPSDAATKNYVDNFKTFTTGASIIGAGYPNGFLTFSSLTGITGIGWANADMSWIGKTAEANKWRQRLTINSTAIGSGTDVFTVDRGGYLTSAGVFAHNLSYDGTEWRADSAGTGTLMVMQNGAFALSSNDTATTNPNNTVELKDFFVVGQSTMIYAANESAIFQIKKKESGKSVIIRGMVETEPRWDLCLGDTEAETATWKGSDFYINAFDNDGLNAKRVMTIDRETSKTTFGGTVSVSSTIMGNTGGLIVAAGVNASAVWVYPNGPANSAGYASFSSDGQFTTHGTIYIDAGAGAYLGYGQMGRNGYSGGYTGTWHNWIWSGGYVYAFINSSNVGAIQMVCDYRYKRDVGALPPTWDAVKKLRPITYRYKANPDIPGDKDSPELRWGFVAHELQTTLVKSAASGEKDEPNVVQSPNVMAIIAALTKTIQEAQERIEALEARLA